MANYISDSTKHNPDDDKKKQITPEKIYDALSNSHKAALWTEMILAFAVLIVALLFVLVVNISGMEQKWATLVIILLLSVPFFMVLAFVYTYYRNIKKLAHGGYRIITDKVTRVVTDDRYVHTGRSGHMEHAMYLYRCGRVVISLEGTYTNSEGDEFFVVVANERSTRPLLVYNTKYYELVDLNTEE